MFSQNEVKNYQQIKASDDLKEQIIKNVDKTHKRNRKNAIRFAAAAACLVLGVLSVNMYLMRNHVLSLDGVPVTYNSRTIDEITPFSVANVRQEQNLRICIPLEVRTSKDAEITVSDGTVTTTELSDVDLEVEVSTIHIKKSDDILWYISHEDIEDAQCNIIIKDKKYVYKLFYDENTNSYNIRQIKNK